MEDNSEAIKDLRWALLKIHLRKTRTVFNVKEGEIWWVAVGKNIGIEINGKSESFSRPVLIYKKLSRLGFMGIPLTTQPHDGTWYIPFEFQDKISRAVLSQAKVMSTQRLYARIGKLPNNDFKLIKNGFKKLYLE